MTVRSRGPEPGAALRADASPLALMVRDPCTQRVLRALAGQLEALRTAAADGTPPPVLTLSQREIGDVRRQWEAEVLRGEHRLYSLGILLARELLGTRRLQLVARIVASPGQETGAPRLVIEETLTREELERFTDHSLAMRIARRYRYRRGHRRPFGKLVIRASFLEIRPLEAAVGALGVRVMTRVKVDEQIWNKVCDAFFDIDGVVQRDKILNRSSKYIKDVFGIKVLTADREASYRVLRRLETLEFRADDLEELSCSDAPAAMTLIETKDYLALPPEQKKQTGWEALKNVYGWYGHVFELQIQTEANYYLEASDLSDTSHRTFEMQRSALREALDARVPHYREFRDVLKVLFRPDRGTSSPNLPPWLVVVP
ncbi:MAG: hypothetical protein H6744_08605 [Deltaproteobacteria bacterium]|nr:hypothetical protein [Deltaproteobacteria bacterium]MCB9786738.1 hypothetical protein [Deltaproteobacteria bacterium]